MEVTFGLAEWLIPTLFDCEVPLAKLLLSFTDFIYSLARDFKITARN